MKKSLLVTLALSFGLTVGTLGTTNSANAATWHNGMPKALQGSWKSAYSKAFRHRFALKIGKTYSHAEGLDPDYVNHTKYRYLGNHIYKIYGYEPIYSKAHTTKYFKWISKHHIIYSSFLKKGYGTSYYR